jgi:hypothetical protein
MVRKERRLGARAGCGDCRIDASRPRSLAQRGGRAGLAESLSFREGRPLT